MRGFRFRRRLKGSRLRAAIVHLNGKYKLFDHYFYPTVPPLAKPLGGKVVRRMRTPSRKRGESALTSRIRIGDRDRLIFIREVPDYAFGQDIEGSTEENCERWGFDDMNLKI